MRTSSVILRFSKMVEHKDSKVKDKAKEKATAFVKKNVPDKERRSKIQKEFTDVNKIKAEIKKFVGDFLLGIKTFALGLPEICANEKVKHFQKRMIKPFIGSVIVSYIIVTILYLPILLIMYLVNLFVTLSDSTWEKSNDMSKQAVFIVPFLMIFILRYLPDLAFDDIYFTLLTSKNPELTEKLKKLPRSPFWPMLKRSLKRTGILLCYGIVFYILCSIKYVELIAVPLADYFLFKKKFGLKLSFICFLISLAGGKFYVKRFMAYWMSARVLGWELLDNYFSRIKMDHRDHTKLLKKNDALLLGFTLPTYFILSIPYIGPIFFGLAFGLAGIFTVILDERNNFKSEINPHPIAKTVEDVGKSAAPTTEAHLSPLDTKNK